MTGTISPARRPVGPLTLSIQVKRPTSADGAPRRLGHRVHANRRNGMTEATHRLPAITTRRNPMTTITAPTTTQSRTTPLWKTGAGAGVVAAATTAVAAIVAGIDVPLEIDREQIPLASFAQLTLFFTAIGVALAKALSRWAAKPQHTFIVTTVVLTALSIAPDLTVSATTATRVVLIATHLVAAAIVVPAVARTLPHAAR
jgi:hypothetical protein